MTGPDYFTKEYIMLIRDYAISSWIRYVLICCLLSFFSAVAAGTALEFKSNTLDLGKIPLEHNEYLMSFEYRNISKEDVLIKDVKSSCGCVEVVGYTDSLMPGEMGDLSVSIYPSLIYGAFEHSVYVYYDDSVEELKIRGYLYEGNPEEAFPVKIGSVAFTRNEFFGGVIRDGLSETASTIVYNSSDTPVLLDFSTNNDNLLFSLSDNPVPPHGTSSLYCSIYDESEYVGMHRYDIIVRENGDESGKLYFSTEKYPDFGKVKSRFGWIVRPKLRISDDILLFDRELTSSLKIRLINKGISTIRILHIDYDDSVIQIEHVPKKVLPFFRKKAIIRLCPDVNLDCKYSKIKIYTDSPKSPVLTVNIVLRQ